MEPEIVDDNWHLCVDDRGEEYWIPTRYYRDEDKILETKEGWGARLSASGFMDSTDWCVYDTEAEAREDLAAMYDLCPECLVEGECECHGADRALREVVDNG
jgi:hypothetical protein